MAAATTPANNMEARLQSTIDDLPSGSVYLVGVAIFQKSKKSDGTPQWTLFVVKRAAHEEAFPNMWELPGGHVEKGETVKQTVDRETIEETGLIVDTVLGEFDELYWTSRSSGKKNVQFNYAVTVKEPKEIRLNPEEHSDWKWADGEEVPTLPCSEAMMKVLKDSIKFAEENLNAEL